MHLPNPFGKPSSRQTTHQRRQRRLVVEGLEARQMLSVDPGTLDPIPLGVTEFIQQADLDPSAGDVWYSTQAGRDGFFSLQAAIAGSPSDATLTLYDSSGQELASSSELVETQRLDWEAAQGDSFLVQISGSSNDVDLTLANLVTKIGDTVTVAETEGDDNFVFSAATTWRRVTINDLVYDFPSSDGTNIAFSAGTGHDTATLYDSVYDDTFEAGPGLATLSSPAIANSDGNGTAFVGYSVSVSGAESVLAYSLAGGTDVAKMYDSEGDDTFVSTDKFGKLFGEGFYLRAKSFDFIHAYAKAGGIDQARMFDSPGRDTFIGTATYAKMFDEGGEAYMARAKFFENVLAHATEGTRDFATLHGSEADDKLDARRSEAVLSWQDSDDHTRSIEVKDFFVTRAYDNSGGEDVATLHDTKYHEWFDASPTIAKLHGEKLYLSARGFDEVHAQSGEYGGDTAYFEDSPGDDRFVGKAEDAVCELSGEGFFLRAEGFDEVHAESTAGGNDEAQLVDSAADDLLEAEGDWASISSELADYLYKVTGFDPVTAESTNGGTDTSDIKSGLTIELKDEWN